MSAGGLKFQFVTQAQEGKGGGTRGVSPLSIQNIHPPLAQIYTPPPKPLKSHPPLIFTNLTSQERNWQGVTPKNPPAAGLFLFLVVNSFFQCVTTLT